MPGGWNKEHGGLRVCANGGVEAPPLEKKKFLREAAETVSRRCHPNLEYTPSPFLICMQIECTNNGYNSLISILYFLFPLYFLIELELEYLLKPAPRQRLKFNLIIFTSKKIHLQTSN